MTKKDYIKLAQSLEDLKINHTDKNGKVELEKVVSWIACDLKEDNKLFDYCKFSKACGF